jgi:hypothetical protein
MAPSIYKFLYFYQKYLGKSARLEFTLGNKLFIAFPKWETIIHCFSEMGKEISLFSSKRKR